MAVTVANPFPRDAVATFGTALPATASVAYARRVREQLIEYLQAYPDPKRRYGGAIGLTGSLGSGKTHLLISLAQEFSTFQSIRPQFLYGKVDAANLFDLYKQLVVQLKRPRLVELINLATREIALEQVRATIATESIEKRIAPIKDASSNSNAEAVTDASAGQLDPNNILETLYSESNLDREHLANLLEERLLETRVPSTIPKVVLSLASPVAGDAAYHWLTGDEIQELDKLGLAYTLRQLSDETDASSAADVRAVDALETLAALHRLAGVPLILLIDQLEVLLEGAKEDRQQTLASVFTKMVEQLERQHALMFVAGTDDGWRTLPRFVAPRLRFREPLPVGGLNLNETGKLLEAYTNAPIFTAQAVETVHRLSGGNPREILRIAHHAFNYKLGDLGSVDEATLLQSAQEAGSLADRRALALSIADNVLSQYGTNAVRSNLVFGGVTLDRIVSVENVPYAALLVTRATDKLAEVNQAKDITAARGALDAEWPGCELLVVAVGYSSEEVRDLLGTTIVFNEQTFATIFQTELTKLAARRQTALRAAVAGPPGPQGPPGPAAPANPELVSLLARISTRLDELETTRSAETAAVQERFSDSAVRLADPERKQRELKTRWELEAALDDLEGYGNNQQLLSERATMRTILISNESYRHDSVLDRLGAVYFDLLSIEESSRFAAEAHARSRFMRPELISDMRRTLRQASGWTTLRRWPWLTSSVGAIIVLVFALIIGSYSGALTLQGSAAVSLLIAGVAFFMMVVVLRTSDVATTWERRAQELHGMIRRQS